MIDQKIFRENLDFVLENLKKRGVKTVDFMGVRLAIDELRDKFPAHDQKRREIISELNSLRQRRNENSARIGKGKPSPEEKTALIAETRKLGEDIKSLDEQLKQLDSETSALLLRIPNFLHKDVPEGGSEDDNVENYKWGEIREFDFTPKHHADLAADLDIMDIPRGVKLAHSRFALMKGAGARLERALTNFMLDIHTAEHGYQEIWPPLLVNAQSMTGTGQLPKFEKDVFKTTDGLYLIPSAEVPLTNIFSGEILKEEDLPIYYTAYTPCFRSEAGSYGKDTKGYIRQHQFNKVELVKFSHPDNSYRELESLVKEATKILRLLKLPYRVITLCSGDIGFSAAKCYDIEVWIPSENRHREISSCSNCVDFQARRANIKYRPKQGGKAKLLHTLNGSGLAVGRTLVAILENYQTPDGDVEIPEALIPYMGGLTIIERKK